MLIFLIGFLIYTGTYEMNFGELPAGLAILTFICSIVAVFDLIISLIFIVMEIYKWYIKDKKFKYLFKLIKHFTFKPMNLYNRTNMNMISCILVSALFMLIFDLYSFGIYLSDFIYFLTHVGRVKFD